MATSREEMIRARAQAIWEAEGRPEGRAQDHWEQAERELSAEATGEGAPQANGAASDEAAPARKGRKRAAAEDAEAAPAKPRRGRAAAPAETAAEPAAEKPKRGRAAAEPAGEAKPRRARAAAKV
jgi:hypothetical protein